MIRTNPLQNMGYIIIETGLTNREYPVKIDVDRAYWLYLLVKLIY